ncbi:MAG TPA: hypothetical protein PLA50_19845, partial [Bacteroidia bacterium]|nr:hypothetical protein [Bacteroidia bacterium]
MSYENMGILKDTVDAVAKEKKSLATRETELEKVKQEVSQIEQSTQTLAAETENLKNSKVDLD